jgi:2-polyprenyl-3-methyl-5-hydroxy-6-metoxy-1,4-benzoquinol methylase
VNYDDSAVPTVAVPACPVCRSTSATVLHDGLRDLAFGVAGGTWTLSACAQCGTVRLDPQPADEAIGGLYASYYTHDPPVTNLHPGGLAAATRRLRDGHLNARLGYALDGAWRAGALLARIVPTFRAIAERPVRGLPAGARVLDVGAGNGLFVAEACAWGLKASGLELDEPAAAAGRSAGLEISVETVSEHAAGHRGAYDAVTLSHVIEHVADPVALLRDCRTLLRSGGSLWIATPNLRSAGHRRYGAAWLHLDPPRHLVLFDAASLTRTAHAAGFVDVRVERPFPGATPVYGASEIIAAGHVAGPGLHAPSPRGRLAALLADARAQLRRSDAEELLLTARAPRGQTP